MILDSTAQVIVKLLLQKRTKLHVATDKGMGKLILFHNKRILYKRCPSFSAPLIFRALPYLVQGSKATCYMMTEE